MVSVHISMKLFLYLEYMGPKVYGYPYILHDLVVGQIFHFFILTCFFFLPHL